MYLSLNSLNKKKFYHDFINCNTYIHLKDKTIIINNYNLTKFMFEIVDFYKKDRG